MYPTPQIQSSSKGAEDGVERSYNRILEFPGSKMNREIWIPNYGGWKGVSLPYIINMRGFFMYLLLVRENIKA